MAERTRWLPGAVLVGVAFVLWLVLVAPRLLVPTASPASLRDVSDAAKRHELQDNRLKLQNDVRATLLQGLGGLAILAGAVFTYRQLRVTREGQVTDRFTRAIEQLGHANIDVRLGGIYALERIAKDSKPDQSTVAEVLCAYVRTHSPWPPKTSSQRGVSLPATEPKPFRAGEVQDLIVRLPDVYAVSRILGRWHTTMGRTPKLPLHDADLQRAALRGDHLEGADLRHTNLQGADLSGAHLEGALLDGANLLNARLKDAGLKGVQATADTIWPRDFDWKTARVELRED
jgi:hypothetical protein